MATAKTYVYGILTFIVAALAVTVIFNNQLKLNIENTKSTFYVFENNKWNISGVEYNSILNGSKKLAMTDCNILNQLSSEQSTIIRICHYADNVTIMDEYLFNGNLKDKEMFPVSHQIAVLNAHKYRYQYDVKSAKYLSEGISSFTLAKNMKVSFSPGYSSKKHTATTITLIYPLKTDSEVFNIKLFDPVSNGVNVTILEDGLEAERNYEIGTTAQINILLNYTRNSTNNLTLCVDIDHPDFGVNYTCAYSNNITINYSQNDVAYTRFSNGETSKQLTSGSPFNISGYQYELFKYDYTLSGSTLSTRITNHWKLNNNSIDSISGNNGAAVGAGVRNITGKINGAYLFNASTDSVTLSSEIPPTTDNGTWAAWVYPNNIATGVVLGKPGTTVGYIFQFTATPRIFVGSASGTTQVFWSVANLANAWHWLCLVRTGNTLELFVDNVSQGTNSMAQVSHISAIGRGESQSFNGSIDDVRIYNYPISASERATIYAAGVGTEADSIPDYPANITLYGQDNQVKAIIPDRLNGTVDYVTRTTVGTEENMTFLTAGVNIRYINLTTSSPSKNTINKNVTFQLSGFAADPNTFHYDEYLYNPANVSSLSRGITRWYWDDYSKDTIDNSHWTTTSSSGFNYVQNNYLQSTVQGCSASTSPNCLITNTCGASATTGSASLNLVDKKIVNMRIAISSNGGTCNSGCGPLSDSAPSDTVGIKDTTVGTYTVFGTAIGNYQSRSYDKFVTIKVEGAYLSWYENDVYVGQMAYNSAHQYELSTANTYHTTCNVYCCASSNSATYFYPINVTGFTTSYAGNLTWNATTATLISVPLKNFTSNLTRAKITTIKRNTGGGSEALFLSNNNGTNWTAATSGNFVLFSSAGNVLKAQLNLTATSTTAPFIIDSYSIDVGMGTVSNPKVDVGNDGVIDWRYNGTLNESTSPQNVSLPGNLFTDYIKNYCSVLNTDGSYVGIGPLCSVPISITSDSAGLMNINNILVQHNLTAISRNISEISSYLASCSSYPCNVQSNVTFSNGVLAATIDTRYYGSGSTNITAHIGTSSVSQLVNWRYSPFNLTYPSGVNYWEVFPSSKVQSNIQPYGQSSSISIWNFTTSEQHTDGVDIYARLNSSINTCVTKINLTSTGTAKVANYSGTSYCLQETANVSSACFTPEGLVAYYPFDDGTAKDYSLNRFDGVLNNLTYTNGYYGGAFLFNKNVSNITLPMTLAINSTISQTFSAWVKTDNVSAYQPIVSGQYSQNVGLYISPTGNIEFRQDDTALTSISKLVNGTWYHIAATYFYDQSSESDSQWQIYINGELDNSRTGYDSYGKSLIYIGKENRYGYQFNGTIDEVSIWNRTLSSTEIQQLYSSTQPFFNTFNVTKSTGSYAIETVGTPDWSALYDGNYSTSFSLNGVQVLFYINYTKPTGIAASLNQSLWQVKGDLVFTNLTIPKDCWNYDSSKIMLRAMSLDYWNYWGCYNGTWKLLNQSPNLAGNQQEHLFEEAMYWNTSITNYLPVNTYNSSFLINVSPSLLLNHTNSSVIGNTWSYTDINCTSYTKPFIIPYFCFFSLCSNCVKTFDYNDTCSFLE